MEQPCLICRIRDGDAPAWHDVVLRRCPGVGLAFAGAGAFRVGYVLVAPERHVESSALIEESEFGRFARFLRDTRELLEREIGRTTLFEHGGCPLRRRSACIDHAHVHVMPGTYDLWGRQGPLLLRRSRTFGSLEAFRSGWDGSGAYLLSEHVRQDCSAPSIRVSGDVGVSQFYRRLIAAQLGSPDTGDYASDPMWDNVRATIELFSPGRGDRRGRLLADPTELVSSCELIPPVAVSGP